MPLYIVHVNYQSRTATLPKGWVDHGVNLITKETWRLCEAQDAYRAENVVWEEMETHHNNFVDIMPNKEDFQYVTVLDAKAFPIVYDRR